MYLKYEGNGTEVFYIDDVLGRKITLRRVKEKGKGVVEGRVYAETDLRRKPRK